MSAPFSVDLIVQRANNDIIIRDVKNAKIYVDFVDNGRIILINSTIILFALRGRQIIVLQDDASTVDLQDLGRNCVPFDEIFTEETCKIELWAGISA